MVESVVLWVHLLGFFVILIPLWVLGPVGDGTVFTTFNNYGAWDSIGTSALVGIFAVILPLLGADAAVHMSEELRDASKTLPRAMILTTVVNGLLGFIMIITFCMVLGPSLDDIIFSPTLQPFIAVFYQATQNLHATNGMSALIIFMGMFCNTSIVATASRQLFAFARDKGTPLGSWIAYVRPGWDVPVNAVLVSWIVTCLASLLNIGSPIAFNSICSISISGVMASYIVSIGCIARRRILNEPMLPSKFSLGRWKGLALNLASLVYLVLFFVMSFFPPSPHPAAPVMNWAIVIFGGIVILALVHYVAQARKVYDGPVEYCRKGI